jgi:hypothetical protein
MKNTALILAFIMCFVSYQGFAGGTNEVIKEFTAAVVKNTEASALNTAKTLEAIENHKKSGIGDPPLVPPVEENNTRIDFTPEYLGMIMRSQTDFTDYSFYLSKEIKLMIIKPNTLNQDGIESKDGMFIVNRPIEIESNKIEDENGVISINSVGKLLSPTAENSNLIKITFLDQKKTLIFRKNVHKNLFELDGIENTDNQNRFITYIGEDQPPYLKIFGRDDNRNKRVEVSASGAVTGNPPPQDSSRNPRLSYETFYADHRDNTYSTPSRYVMGPSSLNRQNVITFVRTKNRVLNSGDITAIINKYFDEAEYEGVNVDIAIAQMLHWTDYLRNRERVETRNYGGLSRIGNWNGKFPYHMPRDGMTEGVRAHIQHLKGYAKEKPKRSIVDPRYQLAYDRGFRNIRFEDVYRSWSENRSYGRSIDNILNDLYRSSGVRY